MKKVLIISYFYPPSGFVGGERTAYWVDNLHKYDIYPILITRNWNENQNELTDLIKDNSFKQKSSSEKTEIYLYQKRNLRDKLASVVLLRKLISLIQLFTKHIFLLNSSNKSFLKGAINTIQEHDISLIIISGRPFENFSIGRKLSKQFNIPWIADYRDQWSTYPKNNLSILNKIHHEFEKLKEKKYLSTAHSLISTSELWARRISELTNKPSRVILNGYSVLSETPKINDKKELIITYAGTLYPEQDIFLFLDGIQNLPNVKLRFIGIEIKPNVKKQVSKFCQKNKINLELINRVPKDRLSKHLDESDFLLLTSFNNVKGWVPVKCYEYYASGVPLLLYPDDNGVIKEFITETNSGYIPSDRNELVSLLEKAIENKSQKKSNNKKRNKLAGNFYSREHQTFLLADLIKSIE
ncbi:MAG: glycosyltransferase [Lishizhenia sp.]